MKYDSTVMRQVLEKVPLPAMVRVRQNFVAERLADPAGTLRERLGQSQVRSLLRPGMKVAVTAGSRGIDNIALLLHTTISFLREAGAEPFVIPAMGSHGGATAEGQVGILRSLGLTEETLGCPIKASMEVDQVAQLPDGTPVWLDRLAHQADGVVVVNRVKPHTGFRGDYESGLFKMMSVGLGKRQGADMVHGRGRLRMGETIRLCGEAHMAHSKILFGVALVENAFDRTYRIEVLTGPEIAAREPELLREARDLLPRILFERLDVLVVDRMGKNISGVGMDTNITKSYPHGYGISREGRARRIAVLDLTDESHGSAVGLGLADVTTRRLVDKMDAGATYVNLITTGGLDSAKIPMFFDNQRMAIQAAIKTSSPGPDGLRLVRLPDTLHLSEIWISEALLAEARAHPQVEVLSEPAQFSFNESGDLF